MISKELAGEICQITDRYSSYVQQIAWFVWLKKSLIEKDMIAVTSPRVTEITDPLLKLWLKKRVWKEL